MSDYSLILPNWLLFTDSSVSDSYSLPHWLILSNISLHHLLTHSLSQSSALLLYVPSTSGCLIVPSMALFVCLFVFICLCVPVCPAPRFALCQQDLSANMNVINFRWYFCSELFGNPAFETFPTVDSLSKVTQCWSPAGPTILLLAQQYYYWLVAWIINTDKLLGLTVLKLDGVALFHSCPASL